MGERAGILKHSQVLHHGVIQLIHRVPHHSSKLVLTIVVAIITLSSILLVFIRNRSKDFELAAEDHSKTFTTDGLFNTRKTSTITPLVELSTDSIGFKFENSKLTRGKYAMSAGGVDMSDRGVYDG